MADEVHVSFSGMADYVRLAEDQQRYLERVNDLVSGACANFGAFTGFMGMFAGSYREAQGIVEDEIRSAAKGAGRLGDRIADTRRDFLDADSGVSNDLGKVKIKVECSEEPPALGGDDGPPGVPAPIKTTNSGLGVVEELGGTAEDLPQHLVDGLPGRTPPLIDDGLRGLPTDGVELISQVADTIDAGDSIGDARDDQDRYEDFEDRMNRRLGGGER